MDGDLVQANGVCSPKAIRNQSKYGTCMPPNDLREIATAYNKQASANDKIPSQLFKTPKLLKLELEKKLGCNTEKCIVQSEIVKSLRDKYMHLKHFYRPEMPSSWLENPRTWLNNVDISYVMSQYEEHYKSFKFVGVLPSDVNAESVCGRYGMCSFNLFDFMATGKRSFGIIFNTDVDSGPGIHWVAVFGCMNPNDPKFGFCYYDSVARPPPHTGGSQKKVGIMAFLRELKADADLYFKDLDLDKKTDIFKFNTKYNIKEHQHKSTECGMFSMLFIILCLERKNLTYSQVCHILKKGSDDFVQSYRKKLFHTEMKK